MVNIILKGVDEFLGSHIEKTILPNIAKILKIDESEIMVICLHSIIYHNGVDQTSYHMLVEFELDNQYEQYEESLADYILLESKNFAVHCHINFKYCEYKTYSRIDKDYPLYVTEANEVVIEDSEEVNEDIYLEDVFADFDKQLKK